MELPKRGRSAPDVLAELASFQATDADFRRGRVFGLVFHVDEELERVLAAAHDQYLWHNALNPDVLPSLRRMQSEVVGIAANLLSGGRPGGVTGFMTSGGTESILLAVKAAKVRAKRERDVHHGNVVMPESAHAAFDKACEYFGLEARRVGVGPDFRADVESMAAMVDGATVLVVGSAPQYPQGVIDPIPEIAALAENARCSMHVDACMGGFVLPFLERLGREVPPWDFRVPGVTTISADIHKYGYTPKGASVIMHRDRASRLDQTFASDRWLGGMYASSGILGTKPGGPIAAAWASMQYLGEAGFTRNVSAAVRAREALVDGVGSIPGLRILGEPDATMAAITADVDSDGRPALDVFAVGDELRRRGWHLDRQGPPESLHATCMPVHDRYIAEFLDVLAEAAAAVGSNQADDRATDYAALE